MQKLYHLKHLMEQVFGLKMLKKIRFLAFERFDKNALILIKKKITFALLSQIHKKFKIEK